MFESEKPAKIKSPLLSLASSHFFNVASLPSPEICLPPLPLADDNPLRVSGTLVGESDMWQVVIVGGV